VTLDLADGTRLDSGLVEGGLSYPPVGWDQGRMEEKFHWLVDPVLGEKRADRLIELVWSFEDQAGINELIRRTLTETTPGTATDGKSSDS
jgi:hypothetical protein